ncbi:hypothetical protein FQA47_020632 [Oryzias melastigma]|uniref:Uncharacterized protein n=1 Tax=Oryzias melastigma TaxID=30732 RepID=A0A834F6H8_ORYME|nr:hypothetical protein FQA47_020632 [Oryzias melastigma]
MAPHLTRPHQDDDTGTAWSSAALHGPDVPERYRADPGPGLSPPRSVILADGPCKRGL